mmetsp:Transcript_3417/g.6235  ORF Transcript_3417/g.6235 Transcript_3417/m.6235 type:complete len:204 (-) Transcript_3417:10-621(-)
MSSAGAGGTTKSIGGAATDVAVLLLFDTSLDESMNLTAPEVSPVLTFSSDGGSFDETGASFVSSLVTGSTPFAFVSVFLSLLVVVAEVTSGLTGACSSGSATSVESLGSSFTVDCGWSFDSSTPGVSVSVIGVVGSSDATTCSLSFRTSTSSATEAGGAADAAGTLDATAASASSNIVRRFATRLNVSSEEEALAGPTLEMAR